MTTCPTCGQEDTRQGSDLTTAELEALSAWWHTGSVKGAANLLSRAPRTVINQLYSARIRNNVHATVELVPMYLDRLRTKRELLTSHNNRQEDAA